MTARDTMQLPVDTLLAEELAADDVVEMANLTSAQTGVPGTIFISTAMGGHEPRVKYFLQPGRSQPSFSVAVADIPTVVASSLPVRVVRQRSPQGSPGYRTTRMRCSVSGTTATPGHSQK